MSEPIIKVEGLGKKYIISHEGKESYTALRDVISSKAKKMAGFQKEQKSKEEFWALKDVSFEINQGDAVGIIGRNGAGKSTLLKILSRITEPTHGRIEINGRIASLLEVGTGFHPELTGRENIFLNGAILGMSRMEIKSKFDEIVDFSGVEKFLDTPVKRYSSGMYVRLAFAVAAHLEPEILVVDEVLAVGDAEFQKKCLGKMNDVSKKEGRTVLFVSHNMGAVQNLCNVGVLMKSGTLFYKGDIKKVVDKYLISDVVSKIEIEKLENRTGTGNVQFSDFYIENEKGQKINSAISGSQLVLVFKLKINNSRSKDIDLGFSFHDIYGDTLSVLYSSYQNIKFSPGEGNYLLVKCSLDDFNFSAGRVQVIGRIMENGIESDWLKDPLGFIDIEMGDYYATGNIGFDGKANYLMKGSWSRVDL